MIAAEQIRALKQAANLSAIARSYAKLRRVGDHYIARCCFHSEKTASLTVWRDRYMCFGCGAKGDVIGFLIGVEGWTFQQAAEYLADHVGVKLDERKIAKRVIATAAENAAFGEWWWKHKLRDLDTAKAEAFESVEVDGAGPGWDWLESVAGLLCKVEALSDGRKWAIFCKQATDDDRQRWKSQVRREAGIFTGISAGTAKRSDLYKLVNDGRAQ